MVRKAATCLGFSEACRRYTSSLSTRATVGRQNRSKRFGASCRVLNSFCRRFRSRPNAAIVERGRVRACSFCLGHRAAQVRRLSQWVYRKATRFRRVCTLQGVSVHPWPTGGPMRGACAFH